MEHINRIFNFIFDLFFHPFKSIDPVYGLCAISFLTTIIVLPVFKYTSDQGAIKRTRDRITGHLLEVRLFKDDLRILFSAQKNILKYNLIHLRYMLKPLMFMIIPVVILIIQTGIRYEYRPFRPGETAIVKVTLDVANRFSEDGNKVMLYVPEGLKVETPLLRVNRGREIYWRLKTEKKGRYDLRFMVSESESISTRSVVVSDELTRLSPSVQKAGFFNSLLHPNERKLPKNSVVESFEVQYPSMEVGIFGLKMHWLWLFLILSLLFSFVLAKPFRVKI